MRPRKNQKERKGNSFVNNYGTAHACAPLILVPVLLFYRCSALAATALLRGNGGQFRVVAAAWSCVAATVLVALKLDGQRVAGPRRLRRRGGFSA